MSVHTDSLEEVCDKCVIEDQHHMKAPNKKTKQKTSENHKSYINKTNQHHTGLDIWQADAFPSAMSYRNR